MSNTTGPDSPLVGVDKSVRDVPAEAGDADATFRFAGDIRHILGELGEDPDREGLRKTPERVEASLRFLTQGYRQSVSDAVGDAVFQETHDSMILVRDIEVYSLCEHHLLPFFGRAHVAYLPAGRIVGLSKLARVVDVFARRLQVQERLTDQIADALSDVLQPRGVGVVIDAAHFCMMMRGVEKQNSRTVTSALRGAFRDDPKTRDEFLRLAHNHSAI
jgi:GTP cyclohydrolase IA